MKNRSDQGRMKSEPESEPMPTSKGIILFEIVDHSSRARNVETEMRPAKLLAAQERDKLIWD